MGPELEVENGTADWFQPNYIFQFISRSTCSLYYYYLNVSIWRSFRLYYQDLEPSLLVFITVYLYRYRPSLIF